MSEYRVPLHIRLNRVVMKPAFQLIFHILGRVKISGKENVLYGKPYVVAFNHISIFDPPLVLSFWPEMAEAIGAADVFLKKGQGPILKMYGVIPVHRGEYDRSLFERVFAMLKSGRPMVMAPEGGRSHEKGMRRALPGIGYIIERAQVPVVPVGLVGTTDDFWKRARRGERPRLEIRIGKPIRFDVVSAKGAERRDARQHIADTVMRHIAGLLPEEYHGYYDGQAIYQNSMSL
ncbi:MAG: lysophospholipid acyltransferase family protein [Chloroflexota bacterium]